MKNQFTLAILMSIASLCFSQQWLQNPTTPAAPNTTNDAICRVNNGVEVITVKPNGQVGFGNPTPNARLELKYCPTGTTNQPGFFINRLECANMGTPMNPVINPPTYGFGDTTTRPPVEWSIAPGKYNLVPITTVATPFILSATPDYPLFAIRKEQLASNFTPPAASNQYENKFIVMANGNTGINTANPRAALDVRVLDVTNEPAAIFGSITPSTYSSTVIGGSTISQYKTQCLQYIPRLSTKAFNKIVEAGDQGLFFTDGKAAEGANQSGSLIIAPWSTNVTAGGIKIKSNGNVEVFGVLRNTKNVVNAQWWADGVFDKTYKLMPLFEVEQYIQANKHLPQIPSEAEIKAEGLDLGNMQALQMQKIEELTLYSIEQQKQIEAQNKAIAEQQKELEVLKAQIKELLNK